jgi:D-alanyl-D-alanine carboxypeptidase
MSTSGAIRLRAAGGATSRPVTSYVYLAGSPRRQRQRRRAVLLWVASLAVLLPSGLQIHRGLADDPGSVRPLTTSSTPQQGAASVIDAATPAQQPSEAGPIDPALSRSLGKAQIAARAAGLDLQVTSGFRSAATQQRLYDLAIAKYGSPVRARRWVLPPAESAHVKGMAVDVGPPAAAAWLEKHGVRYGLCRRYVNEGWHFERLAPAIGQPCPPMEPYAGG